ncbi:hypothetical protein [Streptomyces xiamenensis]|uniref:hypothetical protein n=1 Tax=Streptomyces xiamenensis TaxID=408015 RepID=UPI0035DCAF56
MNRDSNPISLRSVLAVPHAENPIDEVRRISAQWLVSKFGSAPLTSGVHPLNAESTLTNQAAYLPDGAEHAIRLQLRDDKAEATWRTTITALHTRHSSAFVAVTLDVFPNAGHAVTPGRPRLVRDLVAALRPVDGPAQLTVRTLGVRSCNVEALVDVLCDPERRLPVVVAARPLRPTATWSRRMAQAMPQCAGAASLYLLEDAEAVDTFRQAVGENHRVAHGSVRTFLTEVDPAWPKDGPRHRFIPAARMVDPADTAWRGLIRSVQQIASDAPHPEELLSVSFPDDTAGRRHQDRASALATAKPSDEIEILRKENEELRALLSLADTDLKEAARGADLSGRTITSLEAQLQAAARQAEADIEEALRAFDDAEQARVEADILRRRLSAAGRPGDSVVLQQAPGVPASFEELWERLPAFEKELLFTADRETALALDENARARVWAAKTWQGLRSLASYVKAARNGFNGGFFQHCTSDIPGAVVWPHKQVGMTETDKTMARWGDERVFPVPPDVDPSGRAEMQAHLKISSKGSVSPRVYFLDVVKSDTGRLIVGYIGPHLTNTQT